MLESEDDKQGKVFDGSNLRKIWHKACVAAKLGMLTEVEGIADPRYNGLLIHDLRRSAYPKFGPRGSEREDRHDHFRAQNSGSVRPIQHRGH
jgi:hypothetical protein